MSPAVFRIIIVGGGIAGFAAAIALREPNRNITVLEQSSLNKEIGALISFQPNASRIIQSDWGLDLQNARPMVDEGFRIYNTDGKLINAIPLLVKKEYEGDRLLFHRRDLHDNLKQHAMSDFSSGKGNPVEVRVASKVVKCDVLSGIVELETGEKLSADLIIGADGIHSVVRRYVLPEEPQPMPTGLSAYRLMISTEILEKEEPDFCSKINPREPFTSMIVAHNCRLIMGPGRQGEVYGITALVPDEQMNEDPNAKQSWVAEGDLNKILQTFSEFPDWVTSIFKYEITDFPLKDRCSPIIQRHSSDLGLWQLRDLNPLAKWHSGRVVLIGDAAHAMLPTQGQGASQAIEDAEALGAFFEDISDPPSPEDISSILETVIQARYSRASLIQAYSRQAAKPGTMKGENTVTM
ncbi:hypothetical protein N7456_007297 [Penicillium angulare]|uniref:FAD-binding domain-containing protein n=1 Tax=Penicillium angulare TaxID=116970 RepID=A0A9W9FAE2_9EURO|nr:hypothetical protein N7456_007297 [Penicillium angulare]